MIISNRLIDKSSIAFQTLQAGSQTISSHTTAANRPQSERKADRLVEERPNPPGNDNRNENSTCIGSIHFRTGAVCSTTLTMRCDCCIDNTVALTHLAQNTFTSQSAMYFQFTKSTLSHSPCLHLFYETILPSKSEISGSHPKPSGRSGGRIPYIHAV